jgi:exodeoxyribonuclease V alpha subunit
MSGQPPKHEHSQVRSQDSAQEHQVQQRAQAPAAVAARALAYLRAEGALRTIDSEFANLLRRRFGADALVALAGALAMRAVALGHSGFTLDRTQDMLDALAVRATLPPIEAWRTALIASTIVQIDVGTDTRTAIGIDIGIDDRDDHAIDEARTHPVLLTFEDGRVSLRRYARYEQMLAVALMARRGDPRLEAGSDQTFASAEVLRRLFALEATTTEVSTTFDRQAFAAWRSLYRRLLLITGGPGTGKTTTVARLLALQLAAAELRGETAPRIALAAPTGRAAVRLAEAIAERVAHDLDAGRLDHVLAARIPCSAQTLHRLLGARPGRTSFRHDAAHPLPFDLVVVDEASMIDLPLMAKLVAAVAPSARLVLLGDPDQLPAVEAGDVLGGLCAAAGEDLGLNTQERMHARIAFGDAIDAVESISTSQADTDTAAGVVMPLAGQRVHLLHGWRQAGAQALQQLTEAVRNGDVEAVLAQLASGNSTNFAALSWRHGDPAILGDWLRDAVLPSFIALRDADDPAQALQCARRMRVLTALRRGRYGAEFWNDWCAAELGARSHHFHGRLIAIAENSPRHGLYNGDLGVLWHDTDAQDGDSLVAWFETEGRMRAWRPGQLPAHATAFATTVHKAQGSEFDAIALLLPDADSRAVGRELLYTALTRARQRVLLWATPTILRYALDRRSLRDSGLPSRLGRLTLESRSDRDLDMHP